MKMKYIVTVNNDGVEELFVFNKLINHDCMAEVIGRIKNTTHGSWYRVPRRPISAGFIDNGVCYGESITLGLKSRDEKDTDLYNKGCVA